MLEEYLSVHPFNASKVVKKGKRVTGKGRKKRKAESSSDADEDVTEGPSDEDVSPGKPNRSTRRSLSLLPAKSASKSSTKSSSQESVTPQTPSQPSMSATFKRIRLYSSPLAKQELNLEISSDYLGFNSTPAKKRNPVRTMHKPLLPFDMATIFEVAKRVVTGLVFDKTCHSVDEFEEYERQKWGGRIFCDLTGSRPRSTTTTQSSIESHLQTIFTRFAHSDYIEGVFIIRSEFGADWFTPILQNPVCVLRQTTKEAFEGFVAFYLGPNEDGFCRQFRNVGYLPGFNCWFRIG